MFITTRNNYTTLTKDIYLIKVLENPRHYVSY